MGTLEQLQTASFRGIPFLVPSESKTGGKKTVTHEYPNSDKRFTEELGKIPPSFTLQCLIHGDDAINNRLRFESVLEEEGFGTLIHPIYGTVEVKTSGPFTVSSNQRSIGEFRFNVTFETSEPFITPSIVSVDKAQVSSDTDNTTNALDAVLLDQYEDPGFADSLDAAAERITAITQDINNLLKTVVNPIQENIAAFNRTVNAIDSGIVTIVQQGFLVQDSLTGLYLDFMNIAEIPDKLAKAWEDLTSFNLSAPTVDTNTFKRQQISNNNNTLDSHTRLNALARLYESAAYTEFQTDVELDNFRSVLEEIYTTLVQVDNDPIANDPDVRLNFAQLRSTTYLVLNEVEQNVWKITDIEPGKTSIALTTYRYYGDLDNVALLATLNPDVNVSGFNNGIQAVTK